MVVRVSLWTCVIWTDKPGNVSVLSLRASPSYSPHTTSRVEPSATSLALEVFGFLVVDKDLEIVKVPFAVIAPWSRKNLLDIGMLSLSFAHYSLRPYSLKM